MKKLLTLLVFLAPIALFGQTFNLTNKGFVSATDSLKDYLVIEMPSLKQQDLYKKSLIYLSGLYVSPKEVLSVIDNESITVNGIAKKAIKMKVLYLNPSWDVNYTITFQFKDGKVKVNQPVINKMTTQTGEVFRVATIFDEGKDKEIFNKKGLLKQADGKKGLEDFINTYIDAYVKSLNKKEDW